MEINEDKPEALLYLTVEIEPALYLVVTCLLLKKDMQEMYAQK